MIHVENLTKSFHDKLIFENLSFDVDEGETIAIIGPSGSGKSTLVRCLNLLEFPDSGSFTLDKVKVTASPSKSVIHQIRLRTGMVFQSFNLFPHLSVLHNVTIGLTSVQGIAKAEAEKKARYELEQVGLSEHIHKYPSQLSGGQQQRVAIARALALQPKVLLMDEPTSALDPELVVEVLHIIKSIANRSRTLLIVTHELEFARLIADRILFISEGKIVEFEKAEQFFNHPKELRTQQFLQKMAHKEL